MSDELNQEQKTSVEKEVNPDELTEDVLDGASGGAAFAKYDGVDGEALDEDHKGWTDLSSEQLSSDVPFKRKRDESVLFGELDDLN